MDRTTYTDPKVVNLAQKLIPVKINTDKNTVVPAKYKVEALPTIIFLDAKGKILGQMIGGYPPALFAQQMKAALAKARH